MAPSRRYGVIGLGVPKNKPTEIVYKFNKEIHACLADPKMKARLADLGSTVLSGSPADFGKLIIDETQEWAKVVSPRASSLTDPSTTRVRAAMPPLPECRVLPHS